MKDATVAGSTGLMRTGPERIKTTGRGHAEDSRRSLPKIQKRGQKKLLILQSNGRNQLFFRLAGAASLKQPVKHHERR